MMRFWKKTSVDETPGRSANLPGPGEYTDSNLTGTAEPQETAVAAVVAQAPSSGIPKFRPLDAPRAGALPPVDEALRKLADAFTPTRPKHDLALFVGRRRQVEMIISAIEEHRAHVVLFGERGRGKTSLANIIAKEAVAAHYTVARCTCSSHDTFEKIFRVLLDNIPYLSVDGPRLYGSEAQLKYVGELLPTESFGPTEVSEVLARVDVGQVIAFIDEFDRVAHEELKKQLAETIKNLSDTPAQVALFVVGVASSVVDLIGMHPSIQRNLAVVHLPLMTSEEILALLCAAEQQIHVAISPEVKSAIVRLSKGLPYYAQLLGLHATREALQRGVLQVEPQDLLAAIDRVLEGSEEQFSGTYDAAVARASGSLYEILFAAADCESDKHGSFTARDVARALPEGGEIITTRRGLSLLTKETWGGMLEKVSTPREARYRFVNQVMRQYVLARQCRERSLVS